MYDFKDGKGKNIKTGQFNIQGIQLQSNGKLSVTDAKRILDISVSAYNCLLYTSPSPRDGLLSRMPSSA